MQLGQRVFQDVKETVGKSSPDRTGDMRGTLRLIRRHDGLFGVFPPLLKHLRRVHPHLDMRLTVRDSRPIGRGNPRAAGSTPDCSRSPVDESDLVTVPALREELLLMTTAKHPLARRRMRHGRRTRRRSRSCSSRPVRRRDASSISFFASQNIEPTVVMDTENVEIIKAMVRTGLGISIVPYQAVAREVPCRSALLCWIDGHPLFRETGWVYARAQPHAANDQRAAQSLRRCAGVGSGWRWHSQRARLPCMHDAPCTRHVAVLYSRP